MTEQASAGVPARRTRRQLLARGTAALAAVLTAEALARPAPAQAGTDGDVVLGGANSEITATTISNTAGGVDALSCTAVGSAAAVRGTNDTGFGVLGSTASQHGVAGFADTGNGVSGFTNAGAGVFGQSTGGPGVSGVTSGCSGPTPGRQRRARLQQLGRRGGRDDQQRAG
jgi:hypothetical protein